MPVLIIKASTLYHLIPYESTFPLHVALCRKGLGFSCVALRSYGFRAS